MYLNPIDDFLLYEAHIRLNSDIGNQTALDVVVDRFHVYLHQCLEILGREHLKGFGTFLLTLVVRYLHRNGPMCSQASIVEARVMT